MKDRPGSRSRYNALHTYSASVSDEEAAKAQRVKRARTAAFAFGAIALIVASMVINPSVGSNHAFTKASDYKAERDSGCTNSGKGCHGSESSYRDFNDYHPDATCTTCHEYQGAGCIPCHGPSAGHECQMCHDGTMENAPDTVRLTDPYPRGHYRETTHTATGTTMDATVRASARGKAKATCDDCHARDLGAAHADVKAAEGTKYGDSLECGECHNDERSSGLRQVESDWKKRRCEDCHAKDSAAPMHATKVAPKVAAESEQGCGTSGAGCHESTDLHALHPDAPKTCSGPAVSGEPGCHDLKAEANVPETTSCGGGTATVCHRGYEPDRYTHERDRNVHSPTSTTPAENLRVAEVPCGDCHEMGPDGGSLTAEHAKPTSARTEVPGDVCRNCHASPASAAAIAEDWGDRDTSRSCKACHGTAGLDDVHEADLSAEHVVSTGSEGCAETGAGCHPTSDLSAVGTPVDGALHATCVRCHASVASGADRAYSPSDRTCGAGRDCHGDAGRFDPETSVHVTSVRVDGTDIAYHTAGAKQARRLLTDPATGTRIACESCHDMTIAEEHARPTSAMASRAGTICERCHNASAQVSSIVKRGWSGKETDSACGACHGTAVEAPHASITSAHGGVELGKDGAESPGACAQAGCHETTDLRVLHDEAGGCATPGCHSARSELGIFGLNGCGGNDPDVACHARAHTKVDGTDIAHHLAGIEQRDAVYADSASGTKTACVKCHSMLLGIEHTRPNASLASGWNTICVRCHEATSATKAVVRGGWSGRDTSRACAACHGTPGIDERHHDISAVHVATELDPGGEPKAGSCGKDGCHPSSDLRAIHREDGCLTAGCHQPRDDIRGDDIRACGGTDEATACHVGTKATDHGVDHSADLTGTVEGVTYRVGANVGCFGCHEEDLVAEHTANRDAGVLDGGGESACAICHAGTKGAGAYAASAAVKAAIANHDHRCVACHKSGSDADTAEAVASPHRATSTSRVLEPGRVWADPFADWRSAFDATTGGGHNALTPEIVGGAVAKDFPLTTFEVGGKTYRWPLPPNSGATQWLRGDVFGSLEATTAIQHTRIECDDCHTMPDGEPRGPHGSAVRIAIDPAYSQTEYATPTRNAFQFKATGTERVICFKCHTLGAGMVAGQTTPGGAALHGKHVEHLTYDPATNRQYYGAKCVDCHVRIPHAWKRPRLLVRTLETGDGAQADVWPYVGDGHDGLRGVRIQDLTAPNTLKSESCATGGCYTNHRTASHPWPSEMATGTAFWP